ncbi:MAG TPA: hypothetical protein VFH33_07625 [Candidatus Krumholzibacteria bacterium]|nr:hypothetical protein [Candidatus Krumholzibacteria bacterium]
MAEPCRNRRQRIWGNRLDGVLDWAEWLIMKAMPVLLVLFGLPPVVIALDFLTGHKLIPSEHILAAVVVKYGLLFALVIVAAIILGPIAFARWLIRTWRGERMRPALVFLSQHVPWLAMLAATLALNAYLESRLKWPTLLAFAVALAVMYGIAIPWWRWAHPAIERVILRASLGALRAGVVALLVSLFVAGGVWAYAHPRTHVGFIPPEFDPEPIHFQLL